ncbi:MAG: YggS family pyridoxal phosphate-dependent enzyme [Methylococcaceae bacterium]
MNPHSKPVAERLDDIRLRIRAAEHNAGRDIGTVRLIAVSKTQPVEALIAAYQAGQREFGENYVQEALSKQRQLAHFDIIWHFIGPIQTNKTRLLAESFDWVHGVDRLKIAERLSEQRPANRLPLNICLQVNVSGESSKSGVHPDSVRELALEIAHLPCLRLRGLMAIPAPCEDVTQQRTAFRMVRDTLHTLSDLPGLDTLSMGMSDDLDAAITEGASMVRIGTAIFGKRPHRGEPSA